MAVEGLGNVKGQGADRPDESGRAARTKKADSVVSRSNANPAAGGDRVESEATSKIQSHADSVQAEVERRARIAQKERDLLLALANQPAAVRLAAQRLLQISRMSDVEA